MGLDMASDRRRVLFFPQWIDFDVERGIVEFARRARWALVCVSDHGGNLQQALRSRSGHDGVITLIRDVDSDIARYVQGHNIPAVNLSEVEGSGLPRVLQDNDGIGRMGADHLIDQGFEHLAFVRPRASVQVNDRAAGFDDEVRKRGKTLHLLDMTANNVAMDDPSGDARRPDWLANELARLPKPVGIMIHYDGYYWHISEACARAHLRIPEDVAVIGVGNKESVCELSDPTLSSVEHNQVRQGFEAAALLERMMDGVPAPSRPTQVPPLYVTVRESTDSFAVHDQTVRRALYFLRDHFREPNVGVADVVKACGTSRRHLYSAFEKHWHRPIADALAELRITEAKRLLLTTEDKQYAVAMQSGFASQAQLSRAFSRRVGMAPGAFRSARTLSLVDLSE
jgi:LacI family transcriptional regulator